MTTTLNKYMNIDGIEFSVTNACTSKCKHCSRGDFLETDKICIDTDKAVSVIKELSEFYNIDSVMTFGGEPLLYADTVCEIHKISKQLGISSRQIITNGFFSKDVEKISSVAKALKESGVNSLLLSIDVFHSEHLPIETVKDFAKALCIEKIEGFQLHPAWVVNHEHINDYNKDTEKCLEYFSDLHIPISSGNNIFPSGNAAKYLSEFYEKKPIDLNVKCGEMPYTSRLDDIKTIAINPNGDVIVCSFIIGNINIDSITDIIKRYNPYENLLMCSLINGGVGELLSLAENNDVWIDITQFYSACGVCREIARKLVLV